MGVRIERIAEEAITVNGRSGPRLIFTGMAGTASSYRCYAVLVEGVVCLFAGPSIGYAMISDEEVAAALKS